MRVRSSAASRRRGSVVGMMVFVVAFVGANGGTIARAQGGRALDQHPAQGTNVPGILNPYAAPPIRGSYSSYLAKDPTAAERVEVAGRIYRAVLDDWVRRAGMPPRPGGGAADVEARSLLELVERLGPWSLRWQEAQDEVAKSRAARYQSLSDHLVRMSDLEHGRFRHGSDRAKAAGAPVEPKADDIPAEAARFFRPIDRWSLDQVIPTRLQPGRPLNPVGVGVTPAQQAEIAARVYRARSWMKRSVDTWHRPARVRHAGRRRRSSTPPSPSGWRSGRTSGAKRRTQRTGIRPRDRPRLALHSAGYEPLGPAGPWRRSGRTSSG